MNAAKLDRNQLIELNTVLTEITAAWDATEEVDTNLGVEVQNAGERLCALLALLAIDPELPAALHSEVSTTYFALETAVNYYGDLDEHDTAAALDIYEHLAPALALADRAVGIAQPSLGFPDWKEVAEPYADGTDPIERYVVTLVVGDDADTTAGEATGPKQAALAALNLTRDEQARSTVWHVYDRHTGITHRYDQSEFDNDDDSIHARSGVAEPGPSYDDRILAIVRDTLAGDYEHDGDGDPAGRPIGVQFKSRQEEDGYFLSSDDGFVLFDSSDVAIATFPGIAKVFAEAVGCVGSMYTLTVDLRGEGLVVQFENDLVPMTARFDLP